MQTHEILSLLESSKLFFSATQAINHNFNDILFKGLRGSSKAMLLASLFQKTQDNYLIVINDFESSAYFYNDLMSLLPDEQVFFFPSAYKKNIKYGQIDATNELLRTSLFTFLQENKRFIIVTYPEAIAEKVVSSEMLNQAITKIHLEQEIDRGKVISKLDELNFEYVDYVYEPGQYAVRGSLLDVFSFSHENPYRIDFFGDEIESIRSFDVESQLSIDKYDTIDIIPDLQRINKDRVSLFSLFQKNIKIGFDDYAWSLEKVDSLYHDSTILDNSEYDKLFADKLISKNELVSQIQNFKLFHIANKIQNVAEASVEFKTDFQPLYHKNFELLSNDLKNWIDKGFQIYICSDNKKQHERLKEIFASVYGEVPFIPVIGFISEGFIDFNLKICLFTDHQIFDRFHKFTLKGENVRSGKFALSLKELQQFQIGDYIVHIDHGVGQFGGLVRSDMNGRMQELIKLIYLNGDSIFVSIHNLHKISKYRGKENEAPRVNKLGTGAWNNIKEKAKSKVKEIARDLIKLYAKRREEKGFPFSKDSSLQNELEASFIYQDTPDQAKATIEVKADMESEVPMDRLICGDVGFGKTEVAIRAAFKAVLDSKQVAVLVPTTVLAFQHYKTFTDRLQGFPCRIDYISRARTAKQVKEIVQSLKEGRIDILIGTHKIVGKDIEFKDLGLMIVDEEQKFGVAIKEKLRQNKVNLDTLSLSATPIPRTLQFSLMGARDMSTLNTPPSNRYPIQTSVYVPDASIIKEAIEFEMSRNGQTFIINDRISNIQDIANVVTREVPEARVIIGHGQMEPAKLEEIMIGFINHEYDVLIATSIIEAGIDVPNANTILINNAHHFGLSDLHQLRGRVGRSNRKAYAYLLAPPLHTLSKESRRRLQAIENFSELGHGIHIAMQDLDIRGAGNLLGTSQSGFVADLGYEVYQKILSEAVAELKNDEFAELYHEKDEDGKIEGSNFVEDVQIESDMELLFAADYIPNDSERIMLYRELDNINKEFDLTEFTKRMIDRFGKPKYEGEELLNIVKLRIYAKSIGIAKIVLKLGVMNLYLIEDDSSPFFQSSAFDKIIAYVQGNPWRCEFKQKGTKRFIKIQDIDSVAEACKILNGILEQKIK